jgi:antitoxin FitA
LTPYGQPASFRHNPPLGQNFPPSSNKSCKPTKTTLREADRFDTSDGIDIIVIIASLLIRNLSDETKRALTIKAIENGRSMNEEARSLIEAGTLKTMRPKDSIQEINWVDKMLSDLRAIGDAEFDELPRDEAPPPPDFSGPAFD